MKNFTRLFTALAAVCIFSVAATWGPQSYSPMPATLSATPLSMGPLNVTGPSSCNQQCNISTPFGTLIGSCNLPNIATAQMTVRMTSGSVSGHGITINGVAPAANQVTTISNPDGSTTYVAVFQHQGGTSAVRAAPTGSGEANILSLYAGSQCGA